MTGDSGTWETFEGYMRQLVAQLVSQRETALAALPAGARLCVHHTATEIDVPVAFTDDTVTFTAREQVHTLPLGQTCGHAPRTEYAHPQPANEVPTHG